MPPPHLQSVAATESLKPGGDQVLDPTQCLVVGGVDMHQERVGGGLQGAPSLVELEYAIGVGPLAVTNLYRARPVLDVATVLDVTTKMDATTGMPGPAHPIGVAAQLHEVAAGAGGRDAATDGWHAAPFYSAPGQSRVAVVSHAATRGGSMAVSAVAPSTASTRHPAPKAPVISSRRSRCGSQFPGWRSL